MQPGREIEVKLRFDSPELALRSLEPLGLRLRRERHFEDNVVFDRPDLALVEAGKLLRLRRRGETAMLTYKAKIEGEHRHKVREEHETGVADAEAFERILDGLGYRPIYRYQKYRTLFEGAGLHVCLDETPLGCFVELEGAPDAIDAAARRMGVGEERYVVQTYRELHEEQARRRGEEPGDLVFDSDGGGR